MFASTVGLELSELRTLKTECKPHVCHLGWLGGLQPAGSDPVDPPLAAQSFLEGRFLWLPRNPRDMSGLSSVECGKCVSVRVKI